MSARRIGALCRMGLLGILGVLLPGVGIAAQQFQGVCAVVKMEILQELALERVGFLATLEITNNEGDASITDFSATLTFENPALSTARAPNDASGLFFVQPPEVGGTTSIDGSGVIRPAQTAVIRWFIIPKVAAGGESATGIRYRVGAKLAGSIYGNPIPAEMLEVIPDTITVRPDPQLEITYFQPRDVDGDDPFTPDVAETPIPFTLGVLVKNGGYGRARGVRVVSEQPRIVENRENLLLVAQLLGARVDDNPTDGASLKVDLGDIEPGKCRKGAWDMITSLSGEFIEFKASYTHASELGGRDTSIIKSLDAYFMVHEVLNDQPGRDGLKDFLADTVNDPELLPDTLYESDCNTLPVNRLLDVGLLDRSGLTARVRARADIENWVYLRLDDPFQAKYRIASVVRSDGKVLNPNNYWTNVRYRRTDNAKLTYLNLFDFVALGDYEYTVTYEPAAQDVTPPVTRLRFSGQVQEVGGVYYVLPETQLYFTAEDESPVGTYYRLDPAAPDDPFHPAYPFRISAAGTHTLEFYSEDSAANREATQTATVVLADGYPSVAGLAPDVPALFIAGDALSVRPTQATLSFDATATTPGATAEAEVFRGAYAWATVAGVPSSPAASGDASLTVGGENVDFYRYRLGAGAWSAEAPVGQPLVLTGLPAGGVTLAVAGRSRYGAYPADADAVTVSWTVGPGDGVAVSGGPATPTTATETSFTVSGSSLYCYRVDRGGYFPEPASGAPIALTRLAEGTHTVEVLPRASAGEACPGDVPGTAARWTVDRSYGTQAPLAARVRRADLGPLPASFTWDGRDDLGVVVPPGWYTVRVTIRDGLGRATRSTTLVQVGDMLADGALLAESGAGQLDAHAFGSWVVWRDQRSGTWNVFARDLANPAGVAAAVDPKGFNQERPRTDGRFVVWEDRQPDGTWDVWAKELGTASPAFAVTATADLDERRPVISWPWVVYQAKPVASPAAPWQLVARNLVSGTTDPVDATSQDQLDPAIHQGRLVWQDFRDVGYGEIYFKDLESGAVRRITRDPGGQYHPAIYGDWIVWSDNRNSMPVTQLDLYGYNLLRGVEIRLTDTPGDEDRPYLNGKWLVYQEDAAGELQVNLRLMHLTSLASVQLTNSGSVKDGPTLASGSVFWTDTGASGPRLMAGTLPDFQAVFHNQNLVAVTTGMAARLPDAYTLLGLWNAQAGVSAITRYTALLPAPVAETASWAGGAPAGTNFPLESGSFLWVKFGSAEILDLGTGACGALDLSLGANVFGYSCYPDHYSAYRLLREVGLANAAAVRLLDAETGRWSVASVVEGSIVGEDFPIPPVAVLMVEMAAPVAPWTPGERL